MDPSEDTLARDSDLLLALTILGPAAGPAPAVLIELAEASLLRTRCEEVGIVCGLYAVTGVRNLTMVWDVIVVICWETILFLGFSET